MELVHKNKQYVIFCHQGVYFTCGLNTYRKLQNEEMRAILKELTTYNIMYAQGFPARSLLKDGTWGRKKNVDKG